MRHWGGIRTSGARGPRWTSGAAALTLLAALVAGSGVDAQVERRDPDVTWTVGEARMRLAPTKPPQPYVVVPVTFVVGAASGPLYVLPGTFELRSDRGHVFFGEADPALRPALETPCQPMPLMPGNSLTCEVAFRVPENPGSAVLVFSSVGHSLPPLRVTVRE